MAEFSQTHVSLERRFLRSGLFNFATRKLADNQVPYKFGSTLTVVPASVPIQWVDHLDHLLQGKLHLILFLGSWTTCAVSREGGTIKSWNKLQEKLSAANVGTERPDTGFVIVIISYQTWAKRKTASLNAPSPVSITIYPIFAR